MILQAVEEIADRYHYEGGLKVTISVPEGEKIARKTFNPVWELLAVSRSLVHPGS